MTVTTLDSIVRNFLMKRRYPFHYYIDFLVYAAEALRELSFDDLKTIETAKLPVNQITNAVELPNGYQDYVRVGLQAGQNIKPLVESDKINPLVARDETTFAATSYGQQSTDEEGNIIYYGALYPYYWNTVFWNSYGEFTGRMFGGGGSYNDTFSVFKERNEIQLNENIGCSHIILQYIGNGTSSDAATQIDPYAFQTISNYINWQMKENSRTYSDNEAERARQLYINERLILRARLSDLTTEKLKRIFQRATYSSPKSL